MQFTARSVSSPMVLLPAYGRQYATLNAMIHDWDSGKDFKIYQGPYCSVRDIEMLLNDCSTLTLSNGKGISLNLNTPRFSTVER